MKKFKKIRLIIITSLISIIFFMSCKKDLTLPDVKYQQNDMVISPNLDGIQDKMIIKISLSTRNFIKYWEMQILDKNLKTVYVKKCNENLEKLKNKVYLKKQNIFIPEQLVWDGKNMNNTIVFDGKYYIKFIVMDNKKNIIDTQNLGLGVVYVDTVKPSAECIVENQIFSPNDDKNKDSLYFSAKINNNNLEEKYPELKGNQWVLDIENYASIVIRKIIYNDQNGNNASLSWDGKDEKGNIIKDGNYLLRFYSTDKGGNYWENAPVNIIVNTEDNPINISVSERAFSPNNDLNQDTVSFNLNLKDKDDVDNWEFNIFDKNKKSVKKIVQKSKVENLIVWNGQNEQGKTLPEGEYYGEIKIVNVNGSITIAESDSFILDVTPPKSELLLNYGVFSPDGNDIKDDISIMQKFSEEKTPWTAKIMNQKNVIVRKYIWHKYMPDELKWFGYDQTGNRMPDGIYYYVTSCKDIAGNSYESQKIQIEVFTKKEKISAFATEKAISPDHNGISDQQEFLFAHKPSKDNPVTDWELKILDSKEDTIYSDKKTGPFPSNYIWNGTAISGETPADGEYKASIFINTFYGVTTKVKTPNFFIDLTAPDIEVEKNKKIFSPDGDGIDDTITFKFTKAYDKTGIKEWELIIISPYTNKPFISYSGTGAPTSDIIWDGKGANGRLVGSAEDYKITVKSKDLAGNSSIKILESIWTDILITKLDDGRLKIRISNINFKPNLAVMTDEKKNIEVLNLLVKALKKYPQHSILIEGYANRYDENLSEKKGYKLSNDRAFFISRELQKRGIVKDRMITIGKGFENPIILLKDNMSEDEKKEMSVNRRVEFYLAVK